MRLSQDRNATHLACQEPFGLALKARKDMMTRAALCLLAAALLAACDEPPTETAGASAAGSPAAFRVRSDMDAPLDADGGWAGAASAAVAVTADAPFRLRTEVEPQQGPQRYGLQVRRNSGDWEAVEAHDFPYPLRELELDFSATAADGLPAGWRIASGDAGELAAGDAALRLQAADSDLIVLYPPPWLLDDAFALAAEFRIPAVEGGRFGLVFGYVDASDHWRLVLDATASNLRVERVAGGQTRILAERAIDLPVDTWLEAEVQLDGSDLELNFNDDELEFEIPLEELPPVSDLGLLVAGGERAEVRAVVIEGESRSPRVSIVTASAYEQGAPTADLLAGSVASFAGGVGVSMAPWTPVLDGAGGHFEIEWPLVIRRFADGGAFNEAGDTFDFRVVDGDERPVAGAAVASVTLQVPDGHLGGTFVETPGRVGPFQAATGDLYFIMEPAESDNLFMVVKSSDGGRSWREVGGEGRPETGDLESVDARLVGDTLHIIHQITESTRYHVFHTADHPETPDRWALTDELATEVTARAQMATLVARSDGSMVVFHLGDTVGYSLRSPAGNWSDGILLDAGDVDTELAGPQAVLGADDDVHVAYYRMDGSIWYRRLTADGQLTVAEQLADGLETGEDFWGPVLPLVYLPESDTLVVVYRGADGQLHERRIVANAAPTPAVRVSDRRVAQHTVDSQQAGADVVSDGESVYVLFIDEGERSIYRTYRGPEADAVWAASELEVDGIEAGWVRGSVLRKSDAREVYGYVYDAGSGGGAGMNRYGEWSLTRP